MRTLFLSDLDGTLLGPDERTSGYTNEVVRRLSAEGVLISYATARSFDTAAKATAGLGVKIPVIVHNGAFIVDGETGRPLLSLYFSEEEKGEIFSAFRRAGLFPLVYATLGGKNRFSYCRRRCSRAQWEFVLSRLPDEREREVFAEEQAADGEVFYFACVDEEERLRPVYDALRGTYRCYFARDIYTGEMWLEVMHRDASKANAALKLKAMLGCERLVCFGDALNDLSMFGIADESYAVENAAQALKAVATGVIASNAADGVAHRLRELCRKSEM